MVKTVHPFPARMAPGLALDSLASLPAGSTVLDPMSGSGTVVRQAAELGLSAVGFDVDPLAVLMSQVWTTPVSDDAIESAYSDLLARSSFSSNWSELDWVARDPETKQFIQYWFEEPQLSDLMRLSSALHTMSSEASNDREIAALQVLRLNLSRIIVTKEQAASLARDTSHSRPHKVPRSAPYDVFAGYEKSLRALRMRLRESPPAGEAKVSTGDARKLSQVADGAVDCIVTSPPYLNAIDYLRGHRMALVWLGWTIPQLRKIRSESVGAERAPDSEAISGTREVVNSMTDGEKLDQRMMGMIWRYAGDLRHMLSEAARVLRDQGQATYVVGNSCLRGAYINNANGVAEAARQFGLREVNRFERELPQASRYLPTTGASLAKRMRTETVLTFAN